MNLVLQHSTDFNTLAAIILSWCGVAFCMQCFGIVKRFIPTHWALKIPAY